MRNTVVQWGLGIIFLLAFLFSFWAFWDMRAHTEFNAAIMGLDILRLLIIICHIGLAALSKKYTSWIPMVFTVFLGIICAFTMDKQGINDQYTEGFTSPILYLTHYGWTFQAINISFLFIETCGALYARAYIEGRGVLEALIAKYNALNVHYGRLNDVVVGINEKDFDTLLAKNSSLYDAAQTILYRTATVQTLVPAVQRLYSENESLRKDVQTLNSSVQPEVQDRTKTAQGVDADVQSLRKKVQGYEAVVQKYNNLVQIKEEDYGKLLKYFYSLCRKCGYESDKEPTEAMQNNRKGLDFSEYLFPKTINQILK